MSNSVSSSWRPGKVKRVTSQASKVPNTRLTGTVISATSTVNQMACSMSGSDRLCHTAPTPEENASIKIITIGTTSSRMENSAPMAISVHFPQFTRGRSAPFRAVTSAISAVQYGGQSGSVRC
ncbi:hypothetical protein D3C81_1853600 [compost metagenome]